MAHSTLFNSRKFAPLFSIQFLNALSDNVLKNAILVMITYEGFKVGKLSPELSVNIATLLFILPFFLFSSYAGKLADMNNKVKLIRLIKYCEILIVILAAFGFLNKNIDLMLFSLACMGIHSTFFGPIKYSILPQYIEERKSLLLANGYIELGTFIAVLVGQLLGSWYAANRELEIVIGILAASTACGLLLSFRLEQTLPVGANEVFSWNIFKDTMNLYRKVASNRTIRNDIHSISWFWAIGVIYTTQLPVFTERYMGGCAHVFSILIGIFSVAIGVGSVVCARLSDGNIRKEFVVFGAFGVSLFSILLLLLNSVPKAHCLELIPFITRFGGVVNYFLIFMIGFSAGFYSVTCYNQLQVVSPLNILSQVIAVTNVLNAAYMLLAAIACTILLLFINLWWLFVIALTANLVFVLWYWKANFAN